MMVSTDELSATMLCYERPKEMKINKDQCIGVGSQAITHTAPPVFHTSVEVMFNLIRGRGVSQLFILTPLCHFVLPFQRV